MISQLQLSLFDTATAIEPAYKVGDLVKIRKRPIAASYVKKGDIVQIVAVHPLNGSIKFWNERSERWEFLHPDEIGSIVPPGNDDSVSTDKAISTYRPRGTARSGEYFRLSYRDGSRMRHIHIRGGNTDSPIAQAKVAEVRSLLAAGISPAQVATRLRNQNQPL